MLEAEVTVILVLVKLVVESVGLTVYPLGLDEFVIKVVAGEDVPLYQTKLLDGDVVMERLTVSFLQ